VKLPQRDDALWPLHVRASVAEGFCPSHGRAHLYDQGDGWWYCLEMDEYWTAGGDHETGEQRWARSGES
jgi:hypothetical protein